MEDRLKFYETGEAPKKNLDVMHEAMQEVITFFLKYLKEENLY